jgi:ferredoxin
MAEITIDTYLCSGCATCVEICPQYFRLDPLGEKAELRDPHPQLTDELYQAASYCPEKCIEIME